MITRHCGSCGHDVDVILIEKVGEDDEHDIWYALCPKGHQFSTTWLGHSIVFVPKQSLKTVPVK